MKRIIDFTKRMKQFWGSSDKVTNHSDAIKQSILKVVESDQQLLDTKSLSVVKQLIMQNVEASPAKIYCEIANFLVNTGQPTVARAYYLLSLEHDLTPSTYSLYLQCLLLDPTCTEKDLYLVASRYSQFFNETIPYQNYLITMDKDKVLHIGYICHFFHNSVSKSLLLPFLKAHDRSQIKVFCYSDAPNHEVEDRVKTVADVWVDTEHMSDEVLAARIREDKIDILLELNGHCVVNRYGVIAKKPAPVQINYYNQAGTAGMPAIDYILIGDGVRLHQSEDCFAESFYHLKGISGVAIFPDNFPSVAPPPFLNNGYMTFGSFGAAHKVNRKLIELWCKVLQAVPEAKFYMKAGVLVHQSYLEAYQRLFANAGIDLERITFEGYSDHLQMLDYYSRMDIALDTYPHAGGTTTLEAIWQGVPVITLYGERYCSQNGKVVNDCLGLTELVAYSENEFVEKAVLLAQDRNRLLQYRTTLRDAFRQSPLSDAKAHAKRLEKAYRDMWYQYCTRASSTIHQRTA